MVLHIEATYENGVFVPTQKLALADHERVRLTVESVAPSPSAAETIRRKSSGRIRLDSGLAQEIAQSPEFQPDEN